MTKKRTPDNNAKKELKPKLSDKLHVALTEFKDAVDEKKLQKLVKKAAKLLSDGLHHNKTATKSVNKKAAAKKAAVVKTEKKTEEKKKGQK